MRLLLDSTAESIYGIDLDGNCTFANRACLRMLGCESADELLGKNMHDVMHHTRADGSAVSDDGVPDFSGFPEGRGHVDDEVCATDGPVSSRVLVLPVRKKARSWAR